MDSSLSGSLPRLDAVDTATPVVADEERRLDESAASGHVPQDEDLARPTMSVTKGRTGMKWDTFVKIMKDVGFTYVPSTTGSSVRFDPPGGTERSITFHKPYPDTFIHAKLMKEFNKKLKTYYGWLPDRLAVYTEQDNAGTQSSSSTGGPLWGPLLRLGVTSTVTPVASSLPANADEERRRRFDEAAASAQAAQSVADEDTPTISVTKDNTGMKWDTFVKVMKDVGFTYVPSKMGLSVRFDPPGGTERSITFHKPHPDTFIHAKLMKEFNRKLKTYYGWLPDRLAVYTEQDNVGTQSSSSTGGPPWGSLLRLDLAKTVTPVASSLPANDADEERRRRFNEAAASAQAVSTMSVLSVTTGTTGMKWDTFVNVMKDVGFTYVPSIAGSSARFDPPGGTERSITFHKPYPDTFIHAKLMKEFTKKYKTYYGWLPDRLAGYGT